MKIMIIFLVLSVAFVVGTVIYLNNKKKNVNNDLIQANKTVTKEKGKKKSKKELAELLPIKIKDNILCIGNRYSNIVKLGNIDYNMLSNSEQDAIESVLIQTALAIDYPVQFFSTTEFIDTSKIINLIKENKTKNKNTAILEYKDYELNSLDYKKALKKDKRTFWQYYISLLKINHLIIFSFIINKDYNARIIKVFLFFFFFAVHLTVNALFFNDNTMHKIYIDEGNYNFIYQIPQILYSSIISGIIDAIIKFLSLSQDNIIELKHLPKKQNLEEKH